MYLVVCRFLFRDQSLFFSLLGSFSHLTSESFLLRQGQTSVPFPPVMVSATLGGRVDFTVCLGKTDSVSESSGFNGNLVPACAFGRAALAACRGCDFVDEVLYLGHLQDGREGKRK